MSANKTAYVCIPMHTYKKLTRGSMMLLWDATAY